MGLERLCARFPRPSWRGGVGMAWLRTVRNGVPLMTAPCLLLDPVCLATLNTGTPFVGPLPVTLTLTLTSNAHARKGVVVCASSCLSRHAQMRLGTSGVYHWQPKHRWPTIWQIPV
eukprot:240401-Chlamydomonas_euryale.AAC.2